MSHFTRLETLVHSAKKRCGGILTTTIDSLTFSVLATVFVDVIAFVSYFIGITLVLVTITIRLLRVYRIFLCKDWFHLGKCWKNAPLILIAIFVSLIPNIMIVGVYIGYQLNKWFVYLHYTSVGLFALSLSMFLIVSFFLAIQMRKIKYKNFKDKSILLLLAFMMIIWIVIVPTIFVLLITNLPIKYQAIITVRIVTALTLATACQLILFTTKLLPVVREKLFPEAQTTSITNVALYQQQPPQQSILNTSPKQFHFKTLYVHVD